MARRMPPSMDFYVDDFIGGTDWMSEEELGVYMRLLLHQWRRGFVDENWLGRILKSSETIETGRFLLQEKFQQQDDGTYVNARMERSRDRAMRRYESSIENGRKGGRPKTIQENGQHKRNLDVTGRFSGENPDVTQPLTQMEPNQKGTEGGSRKGKKEVGSRKVDLRPTLFDVFWEKVPNKTGKQAALKAFDRAVSVAATEKGISRHDAAKVIIERMAAYAETPKGKGETGYRPNPATWLSEGRYDDDPAMWQSETNNGEPKKRESTRI